MAFDEIQLPTNISERAQGGPCYSTVVVSTASGAEQRVQMWSRGRLRWSIGYLDNPTDMATLVAFFRARGGKGRGFRFKDWSDYQASGEPFVNPYPGTVGQLIKTYTSSTSSEVRTILKPVATPAVVIYENGVALVAGTNYTLDTTTGIVTFLTGHPVSGAAYTWTGQFDVPVRFDTDEMKIALESVMYASWDSVPVVELFAGSY